MLIQFSKLINSIFSNKFTLVPCGRNPCYCLVQRLQKDDKDYIECYKTWDNYNRKREKNCKDDMCFFSRY